jgi:hypothetical protein
MRMLDRWQRLGAPRLALFPWLIFPCSSLLPFISFVSYAYESCYLQELQKTEAARAAAKAQTSKAEEAVTPKAPSGGVEAEKMKGAASTPAKPEV